MQNYFFALDSSVILNDIQWCNLTVIVVTVDKIPFSFLKYIYHVYSSTVNVRIKGIVQCKYFILL